MIVSKPKSSIMISIGIVLIAVLMLDGWLFYSLVQNPAEFFWWKLIFTPLLLVIGIAIARKGYTSGLSLTVGNNKLTYRYYLGGKKVCNISDIRNMQQEVVKGKGPDYKRFSILLANGKLLQLSNKENSNYQRVIDHLQKKVKIAKRKA